MKKEILKNLDRYPYYKILSIPFNKKYKLIASYKEDLRNSIVEDWKNFFL